MEQKEIILELTPLIYFSKLDEDWFFRWLKKLKCIKSYKVVSSTLYLTIQNPITYKEYLGLLALFRRYEHDINKLRVFKEHFKESNLRLRIPDFLYK